MNTKVLFIKFFSALHIFFILTNTAHSNPEKLKIGIYSYFFYDIKKDKRLFSANFQIWIRHSKNIIDPFKLIDFFNSVSFKKSSVTKKNLSDGTTLTRAFIRGTFLTQKPFENDPFKDQHLILDIKNVPKSAREVILEPDLKGTELLSPEAKKFLYSQGWSSSGSKFEKGTLPWLDSREHYPEEKVSKLSFLKATININKKIDKFSFSYLYYNLKNIFFNSIK